MRLGAHLVWELAENEEYRSPLTAEMRASPIDGCSKNEFGVLRELSFKFMPI